MDHQHITPSVLDRLLDEHPAKVQDHFRSFDQQLAAIHENIGRDLEKLLNTRRPELKWPTEWDQLDGSLMAYGIPDITGQMLDTTMAQQKLCAILRQVIYRFESRLSHIKVTLLQTDITHSRILRLRIEALLTVAPLSELVIFDSILDPGTGNFHMVDVA